MSTLQSQPSARIDAPAVGLSRTEHAAAREVARRLRQELRAVVALLPEEDSTASALARTLRVDRNTCQRVAAAIGAGEADAAMLARLPGVQGLRQFVTGAGRRLKEDSSREQLAAAMAAIDAFDHFIESMGGSQRRLKQRVEASPSLDARTARDGADDLEARRSLFRCAAEVVGRWSETVVSLAVIREAPGDATLTQVARVKGHIGHAWRATAVPLEIGESAPDHLALDRTDAAAARTGQAVRGGAHQTLGSRPARGDTPDSLLDAFCTRPLPKVTSRTMGNRTIHTIDSSAEGPDGAGGPIDLVLGHQRSTPDRHPATQNPPLGEVWSLVMYPTRRLIFDVYLHRAVASRCIPGLEAHLWSPQVGQQGSSRWSTRFPQGPRLELLGSGLRHAETSGYARHAELTAHVFARLGWNAEEYVGYRCDTAYPVWRAGYCMLFDFSAGMTAASGADAPARG